jgi:methyl-accepting chemotaxis protein
VNGISDWVQRLDSMAQHKTALAEETATAIDWTRQRAGGLNDSVARPRLHV